VSSTSSFQNLERAHLLDVLTSEIAATVPQIPVIAVFTLSVTGKPKGNPSLYSILYYTMKMYDMMV
jgi:hypothetical protein